MALAVTVLLLIIPVVHFVSGPIGPFVGGFHRNWKVGEKAGIGVCGGLGFRVGAMAAAGCHLSDSHNSVGICD